MLAIVDDAPGSLLEHRRERVLAHEERAREVDAQHPLPLVDLDEVDGAAAGDPGGVHDDVEPALLTQVRTQRFGDPDSLVTSTRVRGRPRLGLVGGDRGVHAHYVAPFGEEPPGAGEHVPRTRR